MTTEFYQALQDSYNYESPITAGKAMRQLGFYIASGKATLKECAEGIDCLILAASSGNGNLRWGASDGFQEIFMSEGLNGADLIDAFLEGSEVFKSLGQSQRQLLQNMMEEATNLYVGAHREDPNPRLDNFQGHVFEVSYLKPSCRRHLELRRYG
jgi:hypothetical protein